MLYSSPSKHSSDTGPVAATHTTPLILVVVTSGYSASYKLSHASAGVAAGASTACATRPSTPGLPRCRPSVQPASWRTRQASWGCSCDRWTTSCDGMRSECQGGMTPCWAPRCCSGASRRVGRTGNTSYVCLLLRPSLCAPSRRSSSLSNPKNLKV